MGSVRAGRRVARTIGLVGAIDVRQYFGDGGEGFERDFAADVECAEHLGEIGVLPHLDALGEGDGKDLLGDRAAPAGDNARDMVMAAFVTQRDGDLAERRKGAQAPVLLMARRGFGGLGVGRSMRRLSVGQSNPPFMRLMGAAPDAAAQKRPEQTRAICLIFI